MPQNVNAIGGGVLSTERGNVMRKLVFIVLGLLAFVQAAHAQDLSTPQRILNLSGAYQPFTLTSATATQYFGATGMDAHAVTYTAPSTVTGVTVTVSGSTDGGITWGTVGSSTSSTATISFTGTYTIIRVVASGMTAAMPALAGVYNGTLMAGHAVMICALSSTTCVPIAVNSSGAISTIPSTGADTAGAPDFVAVCSSAICAQVQSTPPSVGTENGLVVRPASPITSNVTDPNIVFSGAINLSAATTTQILALSGTKSIWVTAYGLTISASVATAQTVTFVQGTGSNCATGLTAITGALSGDTIDTLVGDIVPVVLSAGDGTGALFKAPSGKALCIQTTGVQPVGGWVSAVQFFYRPASEEEFIRSMPFLHMRRRFDMGAFQ